MAEAAANTSTRAGKLRVYLTDDHQVLREGLVSVLKRQGIEVVGQSGTTAATLAEYASSRPDVLILDLTLEDGSGLTLIRELLKRHRNARIVVYSMRESIQVIAEAYRTGAMGYVTKNSPPQWLIDALNAVASGTTYFMPGIAEKIAEQHVGSSSEADPRKVLTRREMDIFIKLAEGKNYSQVADVLGLSTKSVANRTVQIRQKLGLNRSEFTRLAIRCNLIEA